jgi:CubicO group peptidase (beta-lactamase class C family)
MRAFTAALLAVIALIGISIADAAEKTTSGTDVAAIAQGGDLDNREALESFIDGAINTQMASLHIPAVAVGIVHGGHIVFAKGYGYADRERRLPIDPQQTVLRFGSTAKLFVWTAVMQLVEQRRLDLDADVNRYLKSFTIPATYPQPITMRHLMTHTAGFEEGGPKYVTFATLVGAESLRDSLARHMPRRVRPPGQMSAYSNYGAALAGFIVEQVSGESYAEYVRRHIFVPLDMIHSNAGERLPESLAPLQAKAYERKNGVFAPAEDDIVGGLRPPGSAAGTVIDMTHFMLAHLQDGEYGGSRILNSATAQLMRRVAFQGDPRLPGMTLGFYEQRVNGWRVIAHDGDTLHFHNRVYLVPASGFGIFLSYIGNNGHDARDAFVQALFDRYFPPSAPTQSAASTSISGDSVRYEGWYQGVRRYHTSVLKALAPASTVRVDALAGGHLLISRPNVEPQEYAAVGADLFGELQGTKEIAFRTDRGQGVSYLFFEDQPFMPMESLSWWERPVVWLIGCTLSALVLALALIAPLARQRQPDALPARRHVTQAAILVSAWFFLSVLAIGAVVGTNGRALYFADSQALKWVLVMPVVFVVLTALLTGVTLRSWYTVPSTPRERVQHALVLLAALFVCAGIIQWNLLGWQWG